MNASWRKGLLGRGNSKCQNQEVFAFRGRSQWGWSPGTEKEEDVRKEGVGWEESEPGASQESW